MKSEITLTKFWAAFGALIIIILASAFQFSSRMAVNEEKLVNLQAREREMAKSVDAMEGHIQQMNAMLVEINTNQKNILKILEKEKR